ADRERHEDTRHARRGRDRKTELEFLLVLGDVLVGWRAHESHVLVGVELSRPAGRRLPHARGLEAPVVPRIERRRVQDQDRYLRFTPPIVFARSKLVPPSVRSDAKVAHLDRIFRTPRRHGPIQKLVEKLTETVAFRVIRAHHAQALAQIPESPHAEVLLHGSEKPPLDAPYDQDVMLVLDLVVGLLFEQALHVEVVEGGDDRSAGNRRDHLDVPEQPQLGEPCEHADVEEGGTEAASGQRKTELRPLLPGVFPRLLSFLLVPMPFVFDEHRVPRLDDILAETSQRPTPPELVGADRMERMRSAAAL